VDPHSPSLMPLSRISSTPHPASRHCLPMAFFDSEIVQDEARRLFSDYQQLMQLGSEYGKFDREGKKLYIERMEEMMDRYRVFMKRFELSEDFQAKLTVEQLRTQLGQFGMTPETMFQQMHQTLERMRGQLEKEG
jgi:phosphoenolpyruvate carboxylase